MKKVLALLFVCLLLTSCGKKQESVPSENKQENTQQQNDEQSSLRYTKIKKLEDDTVIYTYNEDITFNGSNLKDLLLNDTIKIEDVVSGMSHIEEPGTESYMYIVEKDPAFYVMFCGTDNDKNIYIGTDFDETEQSCK